MIDKNNIPPKSGFEIPDGYFEESFTSIQNRIQLEKLTVDSTTTVGLELPDNYFDNNFNTIKTRIDLERTLDSQTKHGFEVPADYFSKFEKTFNTKLIEEKSNAIEIKKNTKVISLKRYIYPTIGIAASLLLLFGILFTQNSTSNDTESLEMASITDYFDKHDATFYESNIEDFLSEADLQSLENDVALEETVLIDYLEERADSYDFYMQ